MNLFIGDLSGTFCNKILLKYPVLYIMIHLHSQRFPEGIVQFSSVAQSCLTLCHSKGCSTPGFRVHHQPPEIMSINLMMPFNLLVLCPLLLLPPSIFPRTRVFSNKLVLCIRWPKYWSFSFSISLSNEYSGLISFRMNWLDLLTVQWTLKSLLQHHCSKASILQLSLQSYSHIHT